MIEFWGSETCPSCKQALAFLQRTPFEFKYIDVATIMFDGEIPRLVFEDRTTIVGMGPIIQYVKEWMAQMGMDRPQPSEPFETKDRQTDMQTRWSP